MYFAILHSTVLFKMATVKKNQTKQSQETYLHISDINNPTQKSQRMTSSRNVSQNQMSTYHSNGKPTINNPHSLQFVYSPLCRLNSTTCISIANDLLCYQDGKRQKDQSKPLISNPKECKILKEKC